MDKGIFSCTDQFYTLQMYFLNQLKLEPTQIQFSANLKTVLLFQFGYFSFLLFCMRSSHSSDVGEDRLVQRMLAEWKEQENILFILTWKYLRIIPRWFHCSAKVTSSKKHTLASSALYAHLWQFITSETRYKLI